MKNGSHGSVRMEVEGLLGPCKRNNIVGEEIYKHAGGHLRGFRTPDCWGRPNEIGNPTATFWQKATRGTSLANPNGGLHAIDALRPYRLGGCGGDEGRGHSELLGECSSARCNGKTQANIPHLGLVQGGNGVAIQAGH